MNFFRLVLIACALTSSACKKELIKQIEIVPVDIGGHGKDGTIHGGGGNGINGIPDVPT